MGKSFYGKRYEVLRVDNDYTRELESFGAYSDRVAALERAMEEADRIDSLADGCSVVIAFDRGRNLADNFDVSNVKLVYDLVAAGRPVTSSDWASCVFPVPMGGKVVAYIDEEGRVPVEIKCWRSLLHIAGIVDEALGDYNSFCGLKWDLAKLEGLDPEACRLLRQVYYL